MPLLLRRRGLDDPAIECKDDEDVDDLLSDKISELIYNQVNATVGYNQGDPGSQEHCSIIETEGLTLLNEGKVNKEENTTFTSCNVSSNLPWIIVQDFTFVKINVYSLER